MKKVILGLGVMLLGIFWNAEVRASSEEALKIAEFLEQQQLHLSVGFRGVSLRRNGRDLATGFLGVALVEAFEPGSQAFRSATLYRSLLIAGWVLNGLGLSLVAATLVVVGVQPSAFVGSLLGLSPAFWGIFLGAMLLSITGSILVGLAHGALGRAVEEHNRSLLQVIRLRRWSQTTPSPRFPTVASLPAFRLSF